MRSLLFHCKDFGSVITGLSTRPKNITPEEILDEEQSVHDCILSFVTVEVGDSIDKAVDLVKEIIQFCDDTGDRNVFLCPFAHLSNDLADSGEAFPILSEIENKLNREDVNLIRGHFGSDKELLIHLYGHPGNARYREF